MAVLQLKGKIIAVGGVTEVGQNNLKKQLIHFQIPARRDDFGEVRGEDEIWELSVLGDKIEKLAFKPEMELKKATMNCFINSKTIPKTDEKPEMYIINVVIASFELQPEK
jgi:hypothetical protein